VGWLIVTDLRGDLVSSLLVARDNGDGAVSGRFLAEPGHYDDARTMTTLLNASILDDPGFRFLLQLTARATIWLDSPQHPLSLQHATHLM
jgi:hypothetical protein